MVISANGMPRLLVPPSIQLMQTALKSFLGGRRMADIFPPFFKLASKVGGPFSRVTSRVALVSHAGVASPLRELIAGVIGRNDFQIALRVSFGRPNAKTVAMAISNSGEVLCYVKLGSETMTSGLVAHESHVLKQFEGIDMPLLIPPRLYSGTWGDGRAALITGALQLEPLSQDANIAHKAADALSRQNRVSGVALRDSDYWHRVGKLVEENSLDETFAKSVNDIERIWGKSEFDFGASHGDWTRANVGLVEGQAAVLDWERSSMHAPCGIDIAHFAIAEKTSGLFTKSIDIDQVAKQLRLYLELIDMQPSKAEPLIVFALLEMVIRFNSAKVEGLRTTDRKFRPALLEGLRKWA